MRPILSGIWKRRVSSNPPVESVDVPLPKSNQVVDVSSKGAGGGPVLRNPIMRMRSLKFGGNKIIPGAAQVWAAAEGAPIVGAAVDSAYSLPSKDNPMRPGPLVVPQPWYKGGLFGKARIVSEEEQRDLARNNPRLLRKYIMQDWSNRDRQGWLGRFKENVKKSDMTTEEAIAATTPPAEPAPQEPNLPKRYARKEDGTIVDLDAPDAEKRLPMSERAGIGIPTTPRDSAMDQIPMSEMDRARFIAAAQERVNAQLQKEAAARQAHNPLTAYRALVGDAPLRNIDDVSSALGMGPRSYVQEYRKYAQGLAEAASAKAREDANRQALLTVEKYKADAMRADAAAKLGAAEIEARAKALEQIEARIESMRKHGMFDLRGPDNKPVMDVVIEGGKKSTVPRIDFAAENAARRKMMEEAGLIERQPPPGAVRKMRNTKTGQIVFLDAEGNPIEW